MKSCAPILSAIVISTMATLASAQALDAEQEARAREIGKGLRCVVCQNKSIEDSDAQLAADMRALVRERIVEGDTDADVVALVRDRYGDFVLLRPPVQRNTLILWFAPLALVLLAGVWLARSLRRPEA